MVPLLPLEPWPSEFEIQKNDSLALIIEILHLKQNFFETDSCLLSTSHIQNCYEIDRGLIKSYLMFNFYVWNQEVFCDHYEMAHIWARIQAFDQVLKICTVRTCS